LTISLLEAGILCVINLVEEEEQGTDGKPLRSYADLLTKLAKERNTDITYTRLSIRDVDVTSTATMKTILDVIDSQRVQQRPVYVHCWGGRGRTGTVVGCYLIRHGLALGEEALDQIRQLRREEETAGKPSPETDPQCDMVRMWKQGA